MSRWYRSYADTHRNPKVARLSDSDFRLWHQLLCMAAENDGVLPPAEDIKLMLNRRLDHLLEALKRLISGGLIDPLEDGYAPRNWDKRQYKSDTSTPRVQALRAKRNVSETPSDTETETDKTEAKASSKSLADLEKRQAIASCLRVAFPPPLGVTDEQWRDFLQSPKRRKAGMSKTAYSGIVNNLNNLAEHGFPPGEMIALAVERGWVTVKLEWVQNDKRTNGMGRDQPDDGLSPTTRAALAVFGSASARQQ